MTFRIRDAQSAALAQSHSARVLSTFLAPLGLSAEAQTEPNVVLAHGPEGARSLFELDERGRISRYRQASGRQFLMRYTSEHQLSGLVLPSGLHGEIKYGSKNQLEEIGRDGLKWRLQYGAPHSLIGVVYPDGTREKFERDSDQNLLAYSDRNGKTTKFERDAENRIVAVTDANNNTTSFRYSNWDRPDALVRPDQTVEEVVRDSTGCPSEVRIDGVVVANLNFETGRFSEVTYGDGEHITLAYDDDGRITKASTDEVIVVRTYDDKGRLVQEQIGDQVVTADYAYDGQLAAITTDQGQCCFTYDGDRRLATVVDWNGKQQQFWYATDDLRMVRTLPGLQEETSFSPFGLIVQVVTRDLQGQSVQAWQQYARDHDDRVISAEDSHFGKVAYTYDAEGQLLAAVGSDSVEQHGYDSVGNRVASNGNAATYNSQNQVVSMGAERMRFDKQGNLVERAIPNAITRYEFSARNLLKSVVLPNGTRVEFTYDACGRRTTKRVGEKVTRYMWFGNHMIYEWVEGQPECRCDYLFKPGTHEPLAMRQRGAVYYFQNGHDGAPRRLSDAWGQVVWTADYRSFGSVRQQQGNPHQPLRFQGQYADEETGLYYNQARYYAPDLGRYLSRDPLEFAAGPNPYLYCYNDPLGGRDPTGLLSGFWKAAVAVGAIAVGVAVLVVAFPAVITAVGALAVGTAIINAGAVVVAGGLVGAGVGLALAPDGCVECQRKMAWDMAVAGAGAALTAMSMVLFPPLAGGMALAGGGVMGGGAALAMAGAGALVGAGLMNTGLQQAMKDHGEGGGSSKEATESPKKQGDHLFSKGGKKLGSELRAAGEEAELPPDVKARVQQAADEMDSALSDPAFEVKVDKGPGPAGGDAQSNAFGEALQEQRVANQEFMQAAEDAASAPKAQQAPAQQRLQDAGQRLKSANQNVLSNVEDAEATSMSSNKSAIQNGRDAIQRAGQAQNSMVDDVINMLKPKP